jgi:hypothetical protein
MLALIFAAGAISQLMVDTTAPVAGCMMTPQPDQYRAKIIHDFEVGCATNATPSEWTTLKTGGFVMTVTRDAQGNLTGLSCEFPRPKPKPSRDKTGGFATFGQVMNFCREKDGISVPIPTNQKEGG